MKQVTVSPVTVTGQWSLLRSLFCQGGCHRSLFWPLFRRDAIFPREWTKPFVWKLCLFLVLGGNLYLLYKFFTFQASFDPYIRFSCLFFQLSTFSRVFYHLTVLDRKIRNSFRMTFSRIRNTKLSAPIQLPLRILVVSIIKYTVYISFLKMGVLALFHFYFLKMLKMFLQIQ